MVFAVATKLLLSLLQTFCCSFLQFEDPFLPGSSLYFWFVSDASAPILENTIAIGSVQEFLAIYATKSAFNDGLDGN